MSGSDSKISIEDLYEELVKTRAELKDCMALCEKKILSKIDPLQKRLEEVELENRHLRQRLENVERESKRNNIILFGLKKEPADITVSLVVNTLGDLLGAQISEIDLADVHPIGREVNCPVKVKFVSYLKKRSIISRAHKLKGTDVVVDLTREQRDNIKVLRKHLAEAKQKPTTSNIKGEKLYIGDRFYTVDELKSKQAVQEIDPEAASSKESGNIVRNTRANAKHKPSEKKSTFTATAAVKGRIDTK